MTYEEQIDRLTRISIAKPLMPETYIPWDIPEKTNELFLPEDIVSIFKLPEYALLSENQKSEIGRNEVAQVMYSYAWSEALLCLFLSRYLLKLDTSSQEYKFVLRMLIEEYRHQEMFGKGIEQLKCKPIPLSRMYRWIGIGCAKHLSVNNAFLATISIEMIADRYGDLVRKGEGVYPVVRKIAELHNIEEARHILFTKIFLEKRIMKAGFIRRSIYSYIMLLNIAYIRSLYVKREVYERVEIKNSKKIYRAALKTYRKTFGEKCVEDIVPFVKKINGFNWATKWAWRTFLKVKLT